MTKKGTSIKLEDRHLEILETRSRQFGVGKGEYLRNLIDADHRTILNSKEEDLAIETTNARNVNFNELTLSIIKALTREFDIEKNKKKPLSTIRGFAKKYDFKPSVVESILNQLIRNGILTYSQSKQGKRTYQWTYLGITAFPEYAPIDDDDKNLVSGSTIGALSGMLGDYDDIVNYLSTILDVDKTKADSLVRFFLQNYIGFFNWLREVIFPITGVNGDLDNNYYRNQMTDYLIMLISNYGHRWEDWKIKQTLDLKEILQKILDYKKTENDLT